MRIITLLFLTVLTALSAFGANIDYRAILTTDLTTNAFYVGGLWTTNSSTANTISNKFPGEVWVNTGLRLGNGLSSSANNAVEIDNGQLADALWTASTVLQSDSSLHANSIPNGTGALTNNGSGLFGWYAYINGITGGTTNFATTNSNTGLTNAIQSIITNSINQNARIGPGTLNQLAMFNVVGGTNVGDSIMNQVGTTTIEQLNGSNPGGSLANNFYLYGDRTNTTTGFRRLGLFWSVADRAFEIISQVGSAVQNGQAPPLYLGASNATWAISYDGTHYPLIDNAYPLGAPSGRVLAAYIGTSGIVGTIGNSGALNYRMSGGGGWWETGDQTSWQGSNGAEYMRLKKSTPSSLDLGLSPLAFGRGAGAGVGAVDTYILSPAANVIQFGTNDTASGGSAPPTQRLQASSSTGTDTPAATMQFAGGAPSGAGRAGDAAILTSTNGATGSAQRGFQTRTFISAHDVTLTESSPTLVLNVTVPASGYLGIRVMATTHADDASNFQSVTETFAIAAVNKAGTVTTSVSASAPTATLTSSGTLTTAWTAVANGASVDIKNNAVSSLTQTTLATKWRVEVDSDGPAVVVGQ